MAVRRTLSTVAALAALSAACSGQSDPADISPPSDLPTAAAAPKRPAGLFYLLPNLRSLPATDVQILPADDGTRELRFSATLSNTGEGPLVVAPDDQLSCPAGQRHAAQQLVVDVDVDRRYDPAADTVTKQAPGGCMVDHPTHEHWHFDASASYVLTRPRDDTPISASDKVPRIG